MGLIEQSTGSRVPSVVRSLQGVAALAGLGYLIVGLGSFTPEKPDVATATVAEIRDYAAANESALTLSAITAGISAVLLLVLAAAIAKIIERHRPGGILPLFVTNAATIAAVSTTGFAAFYSAWLYVDVAQAGNTTVQALYAVTPVADVLGEVCRVASLAMVAAVSWAALRDGFLNKGVAVLGLMIASAEVVLLAGNLAGVVIAPAMYFAIFGWFMWPAIVGTNMGFRWLRSR
jgi:hypothetical protein